MYKYINCTLPSNGMIYPIKEVKLRAKTIFDITTVLNNSIYDIRQEIDILQNCIDPNQNIDVYSLVNQDVVYLLYKLRSLSNDIITVKYKNIEYNFNISDLEVKYLTEYNNCRELPESKTKVMLAYKPIRENFQLEKQKQEFKNQFPEYVGDVTRTVLVLNAIDSFGSITDKNILRNELNNLSWKDSVYLLEEIEKFQLQDFGIKEEVEITTDDGQKIKLPIEITENFFRSTF